MIQQILSHTFRVLFLRFRDTLSDSSAMFKINDPFWFPRSNEALGLRPISSPMHQSDPPSPLFVRNRRPDGGDAPSTTCWGRQGRGPREEGENARGRETAGVHRDIDLLESSNKSVEQCLMENKDKIVNWEGKLSKLWTPLATTGELNFTIFSFNRVVNLWTYYMF